MLWGLSSRVEAQTAPSPAATQAVAFESPEEALDRARRLFEAGVALTQQSRWAEAASLFEQSRAAAQRPRTSFNLALCLQHLGRLVEAERTLVEAQGAASDAALSRDLDTLLTAVRGALATLTLTVEPVGVAVRVDGARREGVGPTRELRLDPGRHVVDVAAEGFVPEHFELTLGTGERHVRRVALSNTVAQITVRPTPNTATVSVDDLVVGRGLSRWTGAPGAHRVRVEAQGFRPLRQAVTLTGGQSLEVVAALQRDERGGLARNPIFWTVLGLGVVAAVVIPLVVIERVGEPDGGTTNQIFEAATARW